MDVVSYVQLRGGVSLPPMPSPAPFKAIVIAEEVVEAGWRFEVCTWLIRNGCLSFAAWGEACEAWHDDADHVNIADFEGRDIPEDRLVMTTWHDNEPLPKALWFVASVAFHPIADLENTLIVHVADHARAEVLLAQYHAAADE
jgi:hypothetical protein